MPRVSTALFFSQTHPVVLQGRLLLVLFVCIGDTLPGDNLIHVPMSILSTIVQASQPRVPLHAVHKLGDRRAGEYVNWEGLHPGLRL